MKKRSFSLKGHLWATGRSDEKEASEDDVEEDEGREWFAITAFPLFAGTFGTIASALNICALVQPWRCVLVNEHSLLDLHDIPDPPWLIASNAISLIFGLSANTTILFIHRSTAFPLSQQRLLSLVFTTITCGFIASLILLLALVIFSSSASTTPQSPTANHAYTSAYYYAIEAASLYFLTSGFVIYTAYMLRRSRRSRDQDLSKQFAGGHLSLKVLTIVFMAYILIGAEIFSRIEGWNYLDGVFWADVTILTVGFGDFKPQTHLGRCLLFPYAVFGIFLLFLILYCITQVVFERGGSLWEARLREIERRREVEKRALRASGMENANHVSEVKHTTGGFRHNSEVKKDESNTHVTAQAIHEEGSSEKPPHNKKHIERERRREDFIIMREIALRANRRRIYLSITIWLFFSLFLWMAGAILFYFSERDQGWSFFNAIYFTFISLLTIGYGDNNLKSMSGKAIFVLWSLIVIPSLTMLISTGTELVGTPYLSGTKMWVLERFGTGKAKNEGRVKRQLPNLLDPSSLQHNNHDKNHLIVQAIKSIARDHLRNAESKKPADYSFEDWEYIFFLMGVLDDEDANSQTREFAIGRGGLAQTRQPGSSNHGRGSRDVDIAGIPNTTDLPQQRQTGLDLWQEGDNNNALDWLHRKNPLNTSKTVTEWVLLTLVEKLERELREMRRRRGNTLIGESGVEWIGDGDGDGDRDDLAGETARDRERERGGRGT